MKKEMFNLLKRATTGEILHFGTESAEMPLAIEAMQRDWVQVSRDSPIYSNGQIICILILGLTASGYDALDAAQLEKENRRLSKRLLRGIKTVLKWLFGSVERTLLTLLSSDMVLRWLIFFFKE